MAHTTELSDSLDQSNIRKDLWHVQRYNLLAQHMGSPEKGHAIEGMEDPRFLYGDIAQ